MIGRSFASTFGGDVSGFSFSAGVGVSTRAANT